MGMRLFLAVVTAALAGCGGSGGGPAGAPTTVSSLAMVQGVADDAPAPDGGGDAPDGQAGTVPDGTPADAAPTGSEPPDVASPEPVPPTIVVGGATLPTEVDERLRSVFDIVNGDAIELSVAVARRLIDVEVGPREGFTFSRSGVDEETGVEDTTLLCPGGGTLDTSSSSLLSTDGVYVLRGCGIGPLTLDGRVQGRVRGPDRENDGEIVIEPNYEFRPFSVVDARDGRTVSIDRAIVRPASIGTEVVGGDVIARFGYGSITGYDPNASIGPGAIFERRGERSYTVVGTLRTTTRANASTDFPFGGMTTSFEVRFGEETERTEVRTVVPFAGLDAEDRFATGTLSITNEGYAYTLDADDGDPATFRLDVTEGGTTTSYTVPWSAALGFDPFEPERVDLGL